MLLICWHISSVLYLTICRITWSLYLGTRGLTKLDLKIHELTCEACHVHNRRGFGANDGIFLGKDIWSISPLYITFRFDTCMEHLNICRMHF